MERIPYVIGSSLCLRHYGDGRMIVRGKESQRADGTYPLADRMVRVVLQDYVDELDWTNQSHSVH